MRAAGRRFNAIGSIQSGNRLVDDLRQLGLADGADLGRLDLAILEDQPCDDSLHGQANVLTGEPRRSEMFTEPSIFRRELSR